MLCVPVLLRSLSSFLMLAKNYCCSMLVGVCAAVCCWLMLASSVSCLWWACCNLFAKPEWKKPVWLSAIIACPWGMFGFQC
jgi:hypothetical protein